MLKFRVVLGAMTACKGCRCISNFDSRHAPLPPQNVSWLFAAKIQASVFPPTAESARSACPVNPFPSCQTYYNFSFFLPYPHQPRNLIESAGCPVAARGVK
jgi:hypothetical protein